MIRADSYPGLHSSNDKCLKNASIPFYYPGHKYHDTQGYYPIKPVADIKWANPLKSKAIYLQGNQTPHLQGITPH
jgi:hypothetical protein